MSFRGLVLGVLVILLVWVPPASAAPAGGLKGVVHDPQHRPVAGVAVTLKAMRADWVQTATTDAAGEFQFAAVPVGDYVVSVALPGFEAAPQVIAIVSGAAPEMHFQLQIKAVTASASVTAVDSSASMSPTPTTLVTRDDVAGTPGAGLTNSVRMITSFVPGAYVAHDQLHVRGGHQVSWLIDGVPVPNTNIASNVGPQVDPKDIDYMEIQRGSYDAAYGDRTYGVFNVVPRTGFERNKEAELVTTLGSYWQTNDQISFGDHTSRLAYYTSATFNHSDLGLETPVAEVTHDSQSGLGGFGSVIFNAGAHDQLRFVTSVRHDQYQIPIGPDEIAAGMDDNERETDAVVTVSWVRTISPTTLLTVSPFYHYNSADYVGGPADFPVSTTALRSSQYAGAQATFNATRGRHQVQAGFYGYYQHDHQVVGLAFNDGSGSDFTDGEGLSGALAAVFVQDAIAVAPWFTLSAGIRQTHFSGGITEDATSPRVGFALRMPRQWSVRGFYGHFYQGPPLLTASGPLLDFVTSEDLGFIPLHGERDEEYQIGVTVPVRGWVIDSDYFKTSATNYFDHNNVGNSNVFFPVTIDGALIKGWELTVRSPRSWRHAQVHLAYSHQMASGIGGVNGGLTDFSPPPEGSFPLDHDQRNTLSVGADAHWAHGWFGGATVTYGSGFPSDAGWLPSHTTIDLSCGKQFNKNLSVSGSVLNLTDERVLIDNSLTFGGTHYNYPREIYVEFRYRFRY